MAYMRKGKVCWLDASMINAIEPKLNTSDFKELEPYYDVLEEHLLNEGFVLYDDPIEFIADVTVNGFHELRYNCAIVKGTRRNGKFIVNEIGISYQHIK